MILFNGTPVPIGLDHVTVDHAPDDGDRVLAMEFHLKGDTDAQLNIGELGRQYEDDPVVQQLLSYVVRAELLYVLEKSWLAQREREQKERKE